MKSLDEQLRYENNIAYAMIDAKRPFDYVKYLKKEYNINNDLDEMYNIVLDDYNYLKKSGVMHNLVFFSLKRFSDNIVKQYYDKGGVK